MSPNPSEEAVAEERRNFFCKTQDSSEGYQNQKPTFSQRENNKDLSKMDHGAFDLDDLDALLDGVPQADDVFRVSVSLLT